MNHNTLSHSRVLISNVATGWMSRLLVLASGIITLPLLIAHLGKTNYGVWVLIGQAVQILALTDLGTTNSVGRFVAKYRGSGDNDLMRSLIVTVTGMFAVIGVVAGLATLFISPWICILLNIDASISNEAKTIFVISGLTVSILFPMRIGQGLLSGHQSYAMINIAQACGIVLNTAGILILTYTHHLNLLSIALVSSFTILASQLAMTIAALQRMSLNSIEIRQFSLSVAREVFSLGSSAFLLTSGSMIYRQGIVIAVGWLLGTAEAGIYGVALLLITHISSLLTQISGPLMTIASEAQMSSEDGRLLNTSNVVMKISFAMALGIASIIMFYGKPILHLLLKTANWTALDYNHAADSLIIMSIGLALGMPQMASRSILQGVGRHWNVAGRYLIAVLLSLTVACLLMYLGYGIIGAAFGWSLVWILQGVWLYPPLICRYLNILRSDMFIKSYVPGIGVAMVIIFFAWGITTFLTPNSFPNVAIGLLACLFMLGIGTLIISNQIGRVWSAMAKTVG